MTVFHELAIGTTFRDAHCVNGEGVLQYQVWRKVSKSRAECINQVGYGNIRAIGTVNPFAPFCRVFDVKEVAE